MNCEQCQELVSGFVDGVLNQRDQLSLNAHLEDCLSCAEVRKDLEAIVGFCRTNRGEYRRASQRAGALATHSQYHRVRKRRGCCEYSTDCG